MKNLADYTDTELQNMFLDYFNNFLTVGAFADYYGFSDEEAKRIINKGSELHEESVIK